jgi:hypothetical protein
MVGSPEMFVYGQLTISSDANQLPKSRIEKGEKWCKSRILMRYDRGQTCGPEHMKLLIG